MQTQIHSVDLEIQVKNQAKIQKTIQPVLSWKNKRQTGMMMMMKL